MKLDRETMKKIMFLLVFFVIAFFTVKNLNIFLKLMGTVLKFIFPFILGLCIAFVLNVLLKLIENKLFKRYNRKNKPYLTKLKRPLSLLLTMILLFGGLFILFFVIVPELGKAISLLIEQMPNYIHTLQDWINHTFETSFNWENINWEQIKTTVLQFFTNNSSHIIDTTLAVTTSIIGGIVNFILGLVFACYILANKETLGGQFHKLLSAYLPIKKIEQFEQISKLSEKTFSSFITGQVIEAILIGFLCFLGMLILRIPYASMISVLVGVTALIPVFGALIGTSIGALLIITISPMKALWFLIYILVLQQLEGNFIYPKVVGKTVGLPSIWVFIAITLGGSMFGIVGMLVSVPICSILYSIVKVSVQTRIDKRL